MVMENVTVSFVMTQVKCDMPMSAEEQGLLGSIAFLGVVISSHFWGFLGDTWGRQKVIRTSLLGGLIASYISAFSISPLWLIVTRLITGIL